MAFYTYMWLREDGTPYYVGKGTKHRAFAQHNHKVKRPKDKDRILLQEYPDELSSLAAERFFIYFYGREDEGTGTLLNRTDGGEGTSGYKHSEEEKEKVRKAMLGRNVWSFGNKNAKGHVVSAEARIRISEATKEAMKKAKSSGKILGRPRKTQ